MKRLYYGVVTIEREAESRTRVVRHVYHEFFYGLFADDGEAMEKGTREARKRHPDGEITNRTAYRVDDSTIRDAARELEAT